ncbi:uncharacterized protein SPAPADRAFT_142130 [Spathaspora passalidarum NRRL Y-27907]|uniref:LDB19 N-terminal domain-containing protein n=1 Tax=Spathaspora passalidarum (strain NRRL Y-27907 / 11-Y1) TaxID=619300 RepID=G3ATI1_SPAPN|nr:uncharacterized protein SPAPADRAFT_142130 [Spathaspora passalidarum NRRL Y-27907]EGW30944.1 hypothetical protein SPAPADRAFT_142130 [Spathaspora passalidarum NRRL Y-27907]
MSLLSLVLNLHGESSRNQSPPSPKSIRSRQLSPIPSTETKPPKPSNYNISINLESPPIVLYGNPTVSTGSIISGILTVNTSKPVKLESVTLSLVQTMQYAKPFTVPGIICKQCNSLNISTHELARWDVLTSRTTFSKGNHQYPFSHLLPGSLPPTSKLGSPTGLTTYIKYELIAIAKSKNNSIELSMPIPISRSILKGPERNSLRIFPPTDVQASVTLPNVIHPKSTFPIEIKLDNLVSKKRRWRMRKLTWRIDEHTKVKARTCDVHAAKLPDVVHLYGKINGEKSTRQPGVHTSMSLSTCPTRQPRSHHHHHQHSHSHSHSHTDNDNSTPVEPPEPEVEETPIPVTNAHQSFVEDFVNNSSTAPTTAELSPEQSPAVVELDQQKHLYIEETRTVASGNIKSGWKSDFTGRGQIELGAFINISSITSGIPSTVTSISSNDNNDDPHESLMNANISCDIDDPTLGVHVNHTFVVEVVVAEEVVTVPKEIPLSTARTRGATISRIPLTPSISAPATASSSSRSRSASAAATTPTPAAPTASASIPTGAARVLRMQFKLPITERSGLGIAWDDEVPPTYEDIRTFSPPNYDNSSTPTLYTSVTRHVSIDGIAGDLPEFTL